MSFPLVKLSLICEIQIGKTPSRSVPEYWNDGVHPWLSIADMNQGKFIEFTKEKITNKAVKDSNIKLIPQGTLLLSYKLSIGKIGFTKIPIYTNEAIAALTCLRSDVFVGYLYWALKSLNLAEEADRAAMGATLNKAKLQEIKIPLPPIEEQRRIAAILDKAEALRAKRREAIAKLDLLLQSVFLEMFGDPVSNSKKWPHILLKDIGEITTGNTPSKDVDEYYGNYIDWIKSDNLNHRGDYITDADIKLSELGAKKGRIVPKGSILVTCIAGSFDCIGNLAMTDKRVAFNQQINSVTPFKSPSEYVYSLLRYSKPLIQAASTNSMKGMISKGKFSEISFIDTDMNLQIEFSIIFNKFQSIKKKFERSLDSIENLISSLQKKYFN